MHGGMLCFHADAEVLVPDTGRLRGHDAAAAEQGGRSQVVPGKQGRRVGDLAVI